MSMGQEVGKTMTLLNSEIDLELDLTFDKYYAMLDYNRWVEEE